MDLKGDRPVAPITIYDNGDLDVFEDIKSAVHDLEIDDVGVRKAFDSLGRPLRVVDNGTWPVDMVIDVNAEPAPNDLTMWLRTAIRNLGPDWVGLPGFESASLAALLDALLRFQVGVPYEGPFTKLLKVVRRN